MIESLEDFRRKYKGTYVFLDIKDENHLVQYEVDDDDNQFHFISPTFGDILVDSTTARNRLTYYFPKSGLYNINGQCLEFNRHPARQWKRAPCRENTVFTHPLNNVGFSLPTVQLSHSTAKDLFFPYYPDTLEEALEKVNIMLAINPKFGISSPHTGDKNKYLFWYKSEPIGFVFKEEKVIEIHTKQLHQEVVDYIKKEAWTWTLRNKFL